MDSLPRATQRPALLICHLVAAPNTLAQAFVYMPGLLCCMPQKRHQLLRLQEAADGQPILATKSLAFQGLQAVVLCRPLILNKQKVLLASASSAYKHSLKEVMASQGIASQIKVSSVAGQCLQLTYVLVQQHSSGMLIPKF